MSKKKAKKFGNWRDEMPEGYELGLLGNGAWVPMFHGSIIAGDAYFFQKDAIEEVKKHARRRGISGVM